MKHADPRSPVSFFANVARLPQKGFVRQEEVALPDFLANRFGSAYQQSRQVESIS